MNTLQVIKDHGLSIRQILLEVVSCLSWAPDSHLKPGDEVVEREVTQNKAYLIRTMGKHPAFRIDGDRLFKKVVLSRRVPDHAGWWMCQKVSNTDSRVLWDHKTCHLAPTLEESVAKFLRACNKISK